MKKEGMFRISEVSEMFHVSAGTLRHYERLGLLTPEYTDPQTGYRYYSAGQFERLNTIRYLRALDMPLESIGAFLKNRDVEYMRTLLLRQKEEVNRRLRELLAIERKIDSRLAQIDDALSSELGVIRVVEKPEQKLALLREPVDPKGYLDLEYSLRKLDRSENSGIIFLGKVGVGISAERLCRGDLSPYDSVFLMLDEEDVFQGEVIRLGPETCAVIRFRGGHEEARPYYKKLMEFLAAQGYGAAGFSREITMIDDGLTSDREKFVTEIQIPVKRLL